MACGGCMQKYPGYIRTVVPTRKSPVQPKVPAGGRYVIRPVAPPQSPPQPGTTAFPISTKK